MAQPQAVLYRPGQKAVTVTLWGTEGWNILSGGEEDKDAITVTKVVKSVPWLYRAVQVRAQAVSSLPFALVDLALEEKRKAQKEKQEAEQRKPKPKPKPVAPVMPGEQPQPEPEPEEPEEEPPEPEIDSDYDTSDDWQNELGWLPDPVGLLYLLESSLCLYGRAYLFRQMQGRQPAGLQYLVPTTVTPKLDQAQGLTGFERRLGSTKVEIPVESMVYFWLPDPTVEIGPPNAFPCQAALAAGSVLFSVDEFATQFFQSGAIKATILKVAGNPGTDERGRIKSWWQRFIQGKAWAAEIVSDSITTEQIGSGLSELADVPLSQNKREDVSTALGIPQSILFSNAANYATAEVEDRQFYDKTIVPEAMWLAEVLNTQVFEALGLRLEFRPETLDCYQEDETNRAQAFKTYTDAGIKKSIAGRMVGLELPPGVEWDDLDEKEEAPVGMPGMPPQPGVTPPGLQPFAQATQEAGQGAAQDMERWQRKALKALKAGKSPAVPFESESIPADSADAIKDALAVATTEDEVKAAFVLSAEPAVKADPRRELQKRIQPVLEKHRQAIARAIQAGNAPDYDAMSAELRAAIQPFLVDVMVQEVLAGMGQVGVGFDMPALNAEALEWARTYSFDLIRGITDTTRKLVSTAMQTWVETPGMTRGDLEGLLEPAFGPVRAEMIAVTETTRAASAGLNQRQKEYASAGIEMERIWETNNDELVCTICGPLNGRRETDWAGDFPEGPPAHVNCRCATSLRVKRG